MGELLMQKNSREQLLQQGRIFACIARYGIENTNAVLAVKKDMFDAIHELRVQLRPLETIPSVLGKGMEATASTKLSELEIWRQLQHISTQQNEVLAHFSNLRTEARCRDLMATLHFDGIDHRREGVVDSAQDTCSWIYSSEPFTDWAGCNDSKLFCLFGKAGSGKSTLMKHIGDDRRTRDALAAWAGDSALIVADHFFWYPGQNMQKSHEGLLRSLLYKIIAADPAIGCFLCPNRWNDVGRALQMPWNRGDLMQAFGHLQHLAGTKILLLIDGLDEYYPHDSHRLLVEDLSSLLRTSNLKLFVSSRPWPIFEKAFAVAITIRLEDHNLPDIQNYCQSELLGAANEVKDYGVGETERHLLIQLVDEVTLHANGVFLWVYLCIRALTERVRAGASPSQLKKCVRDFPKDLDQFFRDMIYQRISSTWREGSETVRKQDEKDLGHATVDFAHRTVYDFLITEEMRVSLDSSVPAHFHRPDIISRLAVAHLKVVPDYMPLETVCKYFTACVDQYWIQGGQATDAEIIVEVHHVASYYHLVLCKAKAPAYSHESGPQDDRRYGNFGMDDDSSIYPETTMEDSRIWPRDPWLQNALPPCECYEDPQAHGIEAWEEFVATDGRTSPHIHSETQDERFRDDSASSNSSTSEDEPRNGDVPFDPVSHDTSIDR